MAIMVAGGLTFAVPSTMPAAYAEVTTSNPHLYVSAEGQDADNQFAQGNIIEVIIRDDTIGDTDEGEAEPDVTINGADLRMLQTANGDWRAYFAQADALKELEERDTNDDPTGIFDGQLDYGVFCNEDINVSVTGGNVDLSDSNGVYFPPGSVTTSDRGVCTPQNGDTDHPLIRETRDLTDYKNDDSTIGQLGLMYNSLWPFIQVFDFAPESNVKIVYNKGGTQETVTLEFDDPSESHSLDRTKYPVGAHVLVTIEDYALNIDPTDEDTWAFDTNSTGDLGAYYNLFNEDGEPDESVTTTPINYAGKAGIGEQVKIVRNGQDPNGEPILNCQVTKDFGIKETDNATTDYLMSNADSNYACIPKGDNLSNGASEIFTDDNFIIQFVEDGSNNNKFINWADDQKSNLVVSKDADRNRSFEIDYNDPSAISGVVGHFFAELTLGAAGATWNSGERISITVTDEDVNTNPLKENDLTVANPDSKLIPSIRIGSPITLASASGDVVWYNIDDDPVPVIPVVPTPDTTPPTIRVAGGAFMVSNTTTNATSTYVDEDVTCTDDDGTDIPVTTTITRGSTGTTTDIVDLNAPDTYTLTYSCADAEGNPATNMTRTVTVTSDPVITVRGDNPKMVAEHATAKYMDDRVTCEDDNDGNIARITNNASSIDRSQLGYQTITYTCTDMEGNKSTATRTVKVTDQVMPKITILGNNTVRVDQGDVYMDDGAECVDGRDGHDLSVTTTNAIDTSMVGNQTVTYECTDLQTNSANATRIVTVVDVTDPVLVVDPIMEEVSVGSGLTYDYDAGVSCTDNEPNYIITNNGTMVNRENPHTYFIMYTCTDDAGLTDTETRTVTVLDDDDPPTIRLNESNTVPEISFNAINDYVDDLGATCIDNLDDPKQITGNVSAVNKTHIDTYPVTYTCTDQAGNSAIPVTRDVKVVPDANPPRVVFGDDFMDEVPEGSTSYDPKTGVTCEDDVGATLHVSNPANIDNDGVYQVVYTCIDKNQSDAKVRTVTVVAMNTPVITITGGDAVTEGGNATFTITAAPQPTETITVNLNVSDATGDSDFVATSNEGIKSVEVDTTGMATFKVTTVNDENDEPNGVITVTVSTGANYTGVSNSGTVSVTDDDGLMTDPVVTIAGGDAVTEGGNATFTITAAPQPTETITVNLNVSDATGDSDFVATSNEGIKSVEVDTTGMATFKVTTVNDENDEPSGVITVTVEAGANYTTNGSNSDTVTVNDNDDPPQEHTPPEFNWVATPSLLSFTVDQGSIEWDSTDPSDIKLIFSITATIDSSITPISGVYLTAYNSDGDWVKTLGSSGLSDSDNDAANGVNYDVLAADALDDDEAPSGDIIWLVLDDGKTESYSDPVPITVPATGNNVDMTTTPVSYNTAGFPPITRAVINDVSAIPAVHNTALVPKPDLSGTEPDYMYTFETSVESFSDRLRLAEPAAETVLNFTNNSTVVISGWERPTFDEGVVTLFNWNFASLADHADIMGVYLANDTHKVLLSSESSGLIDLEDPDDNKRPYIEALKGETIELVIKLNGKVDHLCEDITLVADFFTFGQKPDGERVNNAIYRIEVEEVTPDNSDFAGTLEYVMLNQLNYDNPATYTGLRTIDVDASIIVHEDFTDEDSVRINYFDLGADGVATQIAVQQEAPTHSGVVSFDADNYKIADTVTITVEDVDLNVNNDVVDIYTFSPPIADADFVDRDGMYMPAIVDTIGDDRDHILDVTFDDETWQTVASCWDKTNDRNIPVDGFNTFTGFTLMETASGSGVFTGDFQIPEVYCKKHNGANSTSYGTVESVTGVDIEVHYQDFRDASGEEVEVGAGAAIRANTGTVSLDRTVYPVPFDPAKYGTATDNSLAHNDYEDYNISGDLGVHIRVNDPDFDVSASGQDKIVNASEYLTVMIIRGADTKPIFLNDTDTVGDLNRDGVKEILEVAPDAGVFELDLTIAHNSGPAQGCPTELRGGCILQGDIIQVEYKDETDASGEENTITDSATFDLRNAVLQSDKSVYLIGSDMILTLIEPDFDLDDDGAETYPLDLIEWDSDADTVAMGSDDRFDPEPNGLRETGDSTGIFQSIIEIPAVLGTNDRLERGEEIELEYVDYGPSGSDYIGDETEDINLTVATSNFGATVELDQKVYSWTDKVYITIVAPDHNFDSASVDEIGDSNLDPIKIATRSADIDNYKLVETGPDTGIFTGEIILIGYDHNADGDTSTGTEGTGYDNPQRKTSGTDSGPTNGFIETDDEGGITVSFEFSEDETVVGSALIRWNIGEVQWLEASYPATGTGVVRVIDPDMNLNPESVDNFEVDIWSDKDAGGIDLTVTETNQATGIFEGTVFFTVADESSGHRLRVAEGNTVTAEYDDNTLPDPYTTADELGVTATTLIGSIVPPLERVPASNLRIVDAFENSLDSVSVDQQVQIVADITNAQERSQEFAYLVQVQDENGVTVSLAWISGTLEAGQSLSPSSSWIPTDAGEYTATAFVWESVDNPTALSPPVTTTITVS